jgi:hypothetical protein
MERPVSVADARQPERKRPRRGALALAAAISALVLVAGYWFLTMGPGTKVLSPAGSTVATFNGTGDGKTASFTVREGWSIHWESTGTKFALAIRGSRDFGTVINVEEAGSGVTSPVGSGTFWIELQTDGPWNIRIEQGD